MKTSCFLNELQAREFLTNWNNSIIQRCGRAWKSEFVPTKWGKTHVLHLHAEQEHLPALIIFPGARTSGLVWELDNAMEKIKNHRIFLIDVNGQPTLSDGNCPDMKKGELGEWASQVMDALHLEQAHIAGASFGGLISLQLAVHSAKKVQSIALLNPAGLASFSMKPKNMFQNLRPLLTKKRRHVESFIQSIVLYAPEHQLETEAFQKLADYQHYVILHHRFKGDYPARQPDQLLKGIQQPCLLLLGENDPLFPWQKSKKRAEKHFTKKPVVQILPGIAHGIETLPLALELVNDWINNPEK